MSSGKIVKTTDKGFGFIAPDGSSGPDIFFHVSGLKNRADFDSLAEGDTVNYEIDNSQDKPRAIEVEKQ